MLEGKESIALTWTHGKWSPEEYLMVIYWLASSQNTSETNLNSYPVPAVCDHAVLESLSVLVKW